MDREWAALQIGFGRTMSRICRNNVSKKNAGCAKTGQDLPTCVTPTTHSVCISHRTQPNPYTSRTFPSMFLFPLSCIPRPSTRICAHSRRGVDISSPTGESHLHSCATNYSTQFRRSGPADRDNKEIWPENRTDGACASMAEFHCCQHGKREEGL